MWNRYALNSTVNTLVTGTYHIHFFCWHHSCSGLLSILPGQSEHCIYRKSQIPNGPSQEKYSVAIHFGFSHFRSSGLNRCQNRTYGENQHGGRALLLFCLRRWLRLFNFNFQFFLILLVLVKVTFCYWKLTIQYFMNLHLDCRLCSTYVEWSGREVLTVTILIIIIII